MSHFHKLKTVISNFVVLDDNEYDFKQVFGHKEAKLSLLNMAVSTQTHITNLIDWLKVLNNYSPQCARIFSSCIHPLAII
jgi:hypothetical protein